MAKKRRRTQADYELDMLEDAIWKLEMNTYDCGLAYLSDKIANYHGGRVAKALDRELRTGKTTARGRRWRKLQDRLGDVERKFTTKCNLRLDK